MTRRILSILLALLLMTVSTGALSEAAPVIDARTEFTTQEYQADYDQLWRILNTSYPFWRELEAFRLENRAKIGESVKDLGVHSVIKDTCGALDNLAYLSVEDPFSYSLYVALLEQGKYEVDDDYIFPGVDPRRQPRISIWGLFRSRTPWTCK